MTLKKTLLGTVGWMAALAWVTLGGNACGDSCYDACVAALERCDRRVDEPTGMALTFPGACEFRCENGPAACGDCYNEINEEEACGTWAVTNDSCSDCYRPGNGSD